MKIYNSFTSWAFGPMKWHVIIGLLMFLLFTYQLFVTPDYEVNDYVAPWVFRAVMVFFGWVVPAIIAFKVVQSWTDHKQGKSR